MELRTCCGKCCVSKQRGVYPVEHPATGENRIIIVYHNNNNESLFRKINTHIPCHKYECKSKLHYKKSILSRYNTALKTDATTKSNKKILSLPSAMLKDVRAKIF